LKEVNTKPKHLKKLIKPTQEKIGFKKSPALQVNVKRLAPPNTDIHKSKRTMTPKSQAYSDFQAQ
jgi:hypothetical protein